MNRKQAFAKFQSELHVSYSQIFTYLSCPLKFKFQYVEQRPQEQVSIALPFGSAIHTGIERYYRSIKKETPDQETTIEMGKGLLQAFYEGIDLTGFKVVDVELPLIARLYTDEGEPTDLTIAGIIDLVLMDAEGNIIAVDNKTAKQPYVRPGHGG